MLERLPGRPPGPGDLSVLADALGRLHGTAYALELHAAQLGRPFHTGTGAVLMAFPTGRRGAIPQLRHDWSSLPAAFYKDANVRNFLITASGPAVVDFDDLTLAPFGYDLAKLTVSTAMTFGHLPRNDVESALAAYTRGVVVGGGPKHSCSLPQLASYAEVHHALTAKYLHRNGYTHAWPDIRPWPAPA
jgi:hypothetical protein